MSILPLQFQDGDTCSSLNLTGKEIFSIEYNIYGNDKTAIIKVNYHRNIKEKKFIIFFLYSLIMVKHFQ